MDTTNFMPPSGAFSQEDDNKVFTKQVEYNGQVIEFPSDASDDEILELLDGIDKPKEQGDAMGLNEKESKFAERIKTIETGGVKNPFIRTKAVGSGSSAYGTYQITKGLLSSVLSNGKLLDEEEAEAMQDLVERQKVALKVGGSDLNNYKEGGKLAAQGRKYASQFGYDDVNTFLEDFDYGGTLGLSDNENFKMLYEQVAHKLLAQTLNETNGDEAEAAARWHGGNGWAKASSRPLTEQYINKYNKLASS